MTAEQVKAMTVPDHQHFWRMLVFKLANLIPETHGRLDSAAGLRVKVGAQAERACVASAITLSDLVVGAELEHALNHCLIICSIA